MAIRKARVGGEDKRNMYFLKPEARIKGIVQPWWLF
jgi:hypothetical protein